MRGRSGPAGPVRTSQRLRQPPLRRRALRGRRRSPHPRRRRPFRHRGCSAPEGRGYSTGMRARLALARAVLHDPDLLLLDEPTAGLDPESARAVLNLIDEMGAAGKTVLMCTHLLLEAEGLADQVVVVDVGHALVSGTPEELTRRFYPATTVTFDAENRSDLDRIADFDGVMAYERNGAASVQLESKERLASLVAEVVAAGIRLVRVEPTTPTLEQLYFTVRREIAQGHHDEVLT
ncbi:MAG: ATP-binding cassette domain-containing protein [Acidimicrobiia bacterium]|nr:ATP-binding cassette domain-containing protein [Acidimicrobiia bacterium]